MGLVGKKRGSERSDQRNSLASVEKLSYPLGHDDAMATAITFPVQINPAVTVLSGLPVVPVRRHRQESDSDRADRRGAMGRHPSSRLSRSSGPSGPSVETLAAPLGHGTSGLTPVVPPAGVSISCADCQFQNTSACDDCIVTFICGSEVRLGADEARALTALQSAGLLPRSQHVAVPA